MNKRGNSPELRNFLHFLKFDKGNARVHLCQPGCTALRSWGLTDKDSWIPRLWEGNGAALLFDIDFKPKSAYDPLIVPFDRKPEVRGLARRARYRGMGTI
jgi:hypothetical protein